MSDNEPFYVGYLPRAPLALAKFNRRLVALAIVVALGTGAALALTLPYFGAGRFKYGELKEFSGVIRCDGAPRLATLQSEYLLVGAGKRGVPLEICGEADNAVTVQGSLIERDGHELIEVAGVLSSRSAQTREPSPVSLGQFTLTGEIVDSKCYFGVMNPAEGLAHRACAAQCLRGGVTAVFVAKDRHGEKAHLLITGLDGRPINAELLSWVGVMIEAKGEVFRQGRWLVLRLDPRYIVGRRAS